MQSIKALLSACLVVLLGSISSAAFAQNALTIGVDGSWKPYGFIDESGDLRGFDVDMAKALCVEMKRECKVVSVPFAGIFAALETKNIDAIVASLNINEERRQRYTISKPYYFDPIRWLARVDSKISGDPSSNKDAAVGTVESAIYAQVIKDDLGDGADIKVYESMDAAMLDLDAGRIDLAVGEETQFQSAYMSQKKDSYKFVGDPVTDAKYLGGGKGIFFRKEDINLKNDFDAALDAIVKNGKRSAISKEYFATVLPLSAQ